MAQYDDYEASNFEGAPIALYTFNIDRMFWNYANSPAPVTLGNDIFAPHAITDEGIIVGDTAQNEDFTIKVQADNPVFQFFMSAPPSKTCFVVHRRKHVGSQDSPILWVGAVSSAKRIGESQGTMICKPITTTLDRAGLRLPWSRQCSHVLYDRNCKVNPANHVSYITVEAVDGLRVFSEGIRGLIPGYLIGGYAEWEIIPLVQERRAIEAHVDNAIQFLGNTIGINVGDTLAVFPGCALDVGTCRQKFNNIGNYGGFPHKPGKSPFDGSRAF